MKVKEITLSEAEITTKPMPGATELDVNGKSVGVAHDAQTAQMISQAAKDGKLSLGATPDGTQPGQQTNSLGEEPATPGVSPVNTKTNPPMVMNNGNTGGVPLTVTSTGGPIDAALIARSEPDYSQAFVSANGKKYMALASHRKYVVSPQDYKEITQRPQGQPYAPATGARETNPGQNLDIQYKESADDQLLKSMLTIAGIR
jgi:hypothetical protein